MKLFEVQTHLTSYAYPVIKIILSISLLLACIFRNKLFDISEGIYNTVLAIISFSLVLLCILILYISIGEICHTHTNRQYRIAALSDTVLVPIDDVVAIAKQNDIVEIEIVNRTGLLKIGSSSDNLYCKSDFFSKHFYIESRNFISAEAFAKELSLLSEKGILNVLSIDGQRKRESVLLSVQQALQFCTEHKDGSREP